MSLQPEAFRCRVFDKNRNEVTYARIVQAVVLFVDDRRDVFDPEGGKSCREPFDHAVGVIPFAFTGFTHTGTCFTHTGILGPDHGHHKALAP